MYQLCFKSVYFCIYFCQSQIRKINKLEIVYKYFRSIHKMFMDESLPIQEGIS